MECGDSSPPWTGQFIGPHCYIPGIIPLLTSPEGEMNFALEGGDESPHSMSEHWSAFGGLRPLVRAASPFSRYIFPKFLRGGQQLPASHL
jgi:hypothetical protein